MMEIKKYFIIKKLSHKITMSLLWIITGLILFWGGRQNNDICRNELYLEHNINEILLKRNINLTFRISESNSIGQIIGLAKCHSQSLLFMEIGSMIMLMGGIYFGYFLSKVKE